MNRERATFSTEMQIERQKQIEFVAGGRCADFAEYRHICGIIRGLELADQIVDDLVQKMEKADEF
jgi:hypothetical protein